MLTSLEGKNEITRNSRLRTIVYGISTILISTLCELLHTPMAGMEPMPQ